MSILSQSGKIILVREPVCGRFGIHRLIAQLTSGALNVSWVTAKAKLRWSPSIRKGLYVKSFTLTTTV